MLQKIPAALFIFLLPATILQAQFCDDPIGFGENATGGTGGTVYTVTNLNDAGAGSLRAGLESTNTYIINFAVSGTVVMNSDIYVKSNKTIDANGTYIRLRLFALRLHGVTNVIIRNIHFDSDHVDHGGSGDAITIDDGTTKVWVDHCTFEDYYDGTVDITLASDFVTVSWCYFRGHDKVMLIGADPSHTSDAGKLHVTVHHCYFEGTTQRHPRSRFGRIHVYNNWMKDLDSYGIASFLDAQTYVEKCRFENVPTLANYQSPEGDGYIYPTGNQIIGGGSIPNTGGVFTPSSSYTYIADAADNMLRDMLTAYVGYNTTTNMALTISGNTMTANYLARSYKWYRNGTAISGATSSSYTAPNCGDYSVRLYGDNGCYKELSHTITTGQPAVPTITVLGGNAYYCTGGSVTLRSTLAPGGYAYQWVRNSTDIAGAISRDYIVTQAGNYRVRLTGACTTANSAVVAITNHGAPDCAGVCGGTAVTDCNGTCNGTAFLDSCGTCSGGTTGHVANSGKDCNGVCGGNAIVDCNGVCGGTAFLDSCGICSGGNTGHSPNLAKDCAGVCNGTAFLDSCGICSGGTTGHQPNSNRDCNGDCNGTAFIDSCGICSGGNTGHVANSGKDCNGVCGGNAIVDCNGVCGGTAFLDSCGICSGGTTGHQANSNKDCYGDCNGTAFIDSCGICSGGNTGHVANSGKDCAGICGGNAVLDCNGVCGGTAVIDSCGQCLSPADTLFNASCRGCDGNCNSGFVVDTCGQCLHPSHTTFNVCATTHSISLSGEKLGVHWYPNPANNEINICISSSAKNMQVQILNSLGQVIKQSEMQMLCSTIQLTGLTKGLFFFRIIENGCRAVEGKFVHQ